MSDYKLIYLESFTQRSLISIENKYKIESFFTDSVTVRAGIEKHMCPFIPINSNIAMI